MKLERLRVQDFRNMVQADLACSPGINLLLGDNGHGKTNVLEAIGLLALGRSFRRAPALVMRRHGQGGFSLSAEVEKGGLHHQLTFTSQGAQQQVRLNGKGVASLSGLAQVLSAVVLTPDAPALIRGAPEERRNYLDWILFSHQRTYASVVRDYQTALRARNQLLRNQCQDGRQYEAWEESLAQLGARIYRERQHMMQRMAQCMADYLHALALDPHGYGWQLAGEKGEGQMEDGTGQRETAYRQGLRQSRMADQRSGSTSVGPHRDDPHFVQGKRLLARFASRGQQKRFLLALKLAEAALLRARFGEAPLLLLDDPLTELDRDGMQRLLRLLAAGEQQLFIALCSEEEMTWPDPLVLRRFRVQEGDVQRVDG
ncbi:MAG: DNA replication and repair protein RecF [Magnetococcales bacterium]|nr:DNA replication and repair protein RecF [Magnetococcales bacterium]MBF0114420.1 DNA replication and repair protein RecF [Magnetococcales bacterium]